MTINSASDVTFVIAAYNAEAFLADAIESALAQTNVTVDVIVVDDHSNDSTAEIAAGFQSRNVRLIRLPENRGPAVARNAAFGVATGRWVAVLDADDAIQEDRTERMIARGDGSDADIVVDNLNVVSGDGLVKAMYSPGFLRQVSHIDLPEFILSNRVFRSDQNFGYMKPMFRRAFIVDKELRYENSLRIGEDYVFLASALACGAICVIEPDPGYLYRIRKGSISEVLERHHIAAMQEADAIFKREYNLDAVARSAMRRRERNLDEAMSYLAMVDHIKNRAVMRLLSTALNDPLAIRHLHMPIAARIKRFMAYLPRPPG